MNQQAWAIDHFVSESRLLGSSLKKKASSKLPDKRYFIPWDNCWHWSDFVHLWRNRYFFDVFSILNDNLYIDDRKVICLFYEMENNSKRKICRVKNHILELYRWLVYKQHHIFSVLLKRLSKLNGLIP